MLSYVEMQAIRNAINAVNSGKKSGRFVVYGRGFSIGHYSVPKSTWVLYSFDGKELFTYNTEIISIDTAVYIFADYIEDHIKRLDNHFYTAHYNHAPVTDYPAMSYYISLEERIKRLEDKMGKSEKFFDTVKEVEKAMDDIWGIIDKWEDMDRNPYMASSGMDAIKEILDNLED